MAAGGVPRSCCTMTTWAEHPVDSEGVMAAAKVMALGKLHSNGHQEIEDVDNRQRNSPKVTKISEPEEVDWLAELLLDDDLVLEDFDFEPEVCSSSSSLFGRFTARRLMQARAQHCVVCMEEKEHTFVPEHAGSGGQHVEGHRFCSDCWMDFLDHSLTHLPAKDISTAAPLNCPLCRSRIYVPDVWAVDIELPPSWTAHVDAPVAVLGSVAETEDSTRTVALETPGWVDESCFAERCEDERPLCRRVLASAVQQSVRCLHDVIGTASAATAIMLSITLDLDLV